MKLVSLFLALVFSTSAFSFPLGVKGQSQTTPTYPVNIQAPNRLTTPLSGGDVLLETGNKNLLSNSGFEHATYSTGWTTSGTATYSAETSAPLSGLKSFKAVASAQTIDLLQDTTLYASARSGSQMFWRFSAKNTAAGVTACVRKNSVKQTGSNDCLTLATDGVTRTYELAFLADGTSNGIEIDAASTTGTLIVDDVELSTESSAFVDVAQIGPWVDYGVIPLTAVTSNPTKGTTTADKVECRTNGQDYECRYRFANTGAGAAAGSGDYLIGLPTGVELNESFYTAYTGTLSGTSQDTNSAMDTSGGSVQNGANSGRSQAFYYGSNRFRLFLTAEFSSTGAWSSGYKAVTVAQHFFFTIKFRGKGLSNKVSTYSQFALSDVSVENVFSAKVDASGNVTGENLDFINGNCSLATSTFTCNFNSSIFTVAPNCKVSPVQNGSANAMFSTQPTSSGFSVITQNSSTLTNTAFAFNVICQKQGADYKAKNIITGSFQGIEKCADPYECTDTFSAKVTNTGVISDENIDWITGNAAVSGTSIFTITLRAGTFTTGPNCVVSANEAVIGTFDKIAVTTSASSSTIVVQTKSANTGAAAWPFNITCQKQGVDFRPKTAVAGTFLESITMPTVTKPKACRYSFGGAGATLTSPTVCSTGTCVEIEDTCGTGTPPAFSATGTYTGLSFASGTWKANVAVSCTCEAAINSASAYDCRRYYSSASPHVTNGTGGLSFNVFATITAPVAAGNTYVTLVCTADAP